MTIDDLKKFYAAKTDSDLARKLKRHRSVIHYWKEGGIPPRTQAAFEISSEGALKADRQALTA
ncbi:hypothetical protein ACG9XR_06830 [Acinetobacter guillouiae]|uniref:hypothetical protein n=1 Tax=Acinetobacter guillouiae TaxID=106649 RepID=UPI003AF822C8